MKILREINILLLFVAIVIISGCISNTANPEITPNVQTNTPISTKIENDSIQETIRQVTENGTQNAIKQAVANGTGKHETSIYWGVKYVLFPEGIVVTSGQLKTNEHILIMRNRQDSDILMTAKI